LGVPLLIGCLLRTGSLLCPLSSVNGQLHIDPCPELLRRYKLLRSYLEGIAAVNPAWPLFSIYGS
jgi:hypothetical protein